MLNRWRGRAVLAVGAVIGREELDTLTNAEVIGRCFRVYLAQELKVDPLLAQFDSLIIDDALAPSATASLLRLRDTEFDAEQEAPVAMIAAGKDDVWVVRQRRSEMPSGSAFAEYVRQRITTDLPQLNDELHVLLRRAEYSAEADRVSIRLAAVLLQQQSGLVVGTFNRVVNADEVLKLLESGHGMFIS
jgi:hypothetical protein